MTATHQRQLIRQAVVTLLTGATSAGAKVRATKVVPWKPAELPAISVYALSEDVDEDSRETAPRELTRQLQLAVECAVIGKTGLDDMLDALTLEVERAMHADETFGGTCGGSLLTSTEIQAYPEGDQYVLAARIVYTVTYRTWAPDADDVAADDFTKVEITYNPNSTVIPDDRPKDSVEVDT